MSTESPDHRRAARDLSAALKDFHRALIRAEVGDDPTLDNPYTQLFALIGDPRFAWMGVVSRLVTRIDEALAGKAEEAPDFAALLPLWRDEAAEFLGEGAKASASDFRQRHLSALQKEPDVGLATGRLRRALAATPGNSVS